jgi:hypothetical protein
LKTGSQALVCQFLPNLYLKENAVPIIKFIFRYFLTMFPKFNSCIHVNDLETRQFGTRWKRQFGTKTFRDRWQKGSIILMRHKNKSR